MALNELESLQLEKLRREKARRSSIPIAQEQPQQVSQSPQTRFQLKSEQPYDSYGYGDAAMDTGKTVLNSLANVGDAARELNAHPIRAVGELLQGVGQFVSDPSGSAQAIGQNLTSTDNPDKVPNWAYGIHTDPLAFGGAVAMAGVAGPAVGTAVSEVGKAASILKPLLKYENALQQAKKAKTALDGVRDTIGKAKEIAIAEVTSVPAEINLSNKSAKVMQAIKNPVYNVEFNPDGSLVKNIGNVDKMKTAVGELINTPAVWKEAPKTEQRLIKQAYGSLNQSMKDAAKTVGKDIAPAIDSYNAFMKNYGLVDKTLADRAGVIQANKLKSAFKWTAEPAVKEAWKTISKGSPELKKVMNTMNRRELLGNLLKLSGAGGGIAVGVEVGKKIFGR